MSRSLYLLVASFLAVGLSWLLQPSLAENGLQTTNKIERLVFITSNDSEFQTGSATTIKWTGYLYQSRAAEIYFHIPRNVQARLVLGSDTVFDTYTQPASTDQAVAHTANGFNPIAFEVTTDPTYSGYVQAGLEWQTFGNSLIPAQYLYPQPINSAQAEQIIQKALIAQMLFWVGVGLALVFVGASLWSQRRQLQTRSAISLALIVLLAFALRIIFLRDYAAQPTADVLGIGSDHRGYQSAALDFVRGTWPPPTPFYIQPGMSLFMGSLYTLFGPHLRLIQIIQLTLGALNSILIFEIGKRALNELTGGIAALLWAIFPLPIFYEAQVLTHGLEPIAGATLMLLWMRSLEKTPKQFFWIVALGVTLGLSALLRPTFLILAPFMALSTFWIKRPHWQPMFGLPLMLAIATCLPIAPITWYNYQNNSGHFQLLTSNSDVTLYLGNNRDSTGLGEYSPAFFATHTLVRQGKTSYADQTLVDIRNDPKRWLQLMIRKTALYLGDQELPNNVYFYEEGVGISPTLNTLPLRFGAMLALAFAGIVIALWQQATRNTPYAINYVLLLTYLLTQFLVVIAYHVFSRFRAPIYFVLPIFAAVPLAFVVSQLQQRRRKEMALAASLVAITSLFISLMPTLAESVMDRPIVSELPTTATPLNSPIGDSLTLVGYDPLSVVAPEDPLFITLYWQSNQPLPKDYYVTVQLFAGEQKVVQADQPIGTGSFPDYPATQWQPGQIVRDTVYIEMPNDAPTPVALSLLVAVYDRDTSNRLGETVFGIMPLTRSEPLTPPAHAVTINARVGTATLNAYAIQNRTLTLYWQAGEPMSEDGIVFIHLFDSQGNFVAGNDSRPRNGLYTTLAWQPGEGIVDEHPLPTVPAGDYTIKIGMYDAATQNRLTVLDADGNVQVDGVLVLGAIAIP